MLEDNSDAFVFFGATGDLAHKMIFPALQAMVQRGHLDIPIIGVAKSGWDLEQLRARARDSLERHGSIDPSAFSKLSSQLQYIDGDYRDGRTFERLRRSLGSAARPVHHLAIQFERVLHLGNDVGWFAEGIDAHTGEQPGNFPQAFTHIALINAAADLIECKMRRDKFALQRGSFSASLGARAGF